MPGRIVGVVVIVVGVIALTYGGFRFAYPDNVANVGPVHVTVKKHATVLMPPVFGVLAIGAGLTLLAVSARKA